MSVQAMPCPVDWCPTMLQPRPADCLSERPTTDDLVRRMVAGAGLHLVTVHGVPDAEAFDLVRHDPVFAGWCAGLIERTPQ